MIGREEMWIILYPQPLTGFKAVEVKQVFPCLVRDQRQRM
jgi:hypothetical protein